MMITQNKTAVYAMLISYVGIALLLALLGDEGTVIDGVIKVANKIFNAGTVFGFSMLTLYVFNEKGNDETRKIASEPLAISVLLGCFFVAIAIAVTC